MDILSNEFKKKVRSHAIAVAAGAVAMLGIGVLGSGGQPNSYYAGLQTQAGFAAEGKSVDLSGLDPVTLSKGATVALIRRTIGESIGSAQNTSMQAYADTACDAIAASGFELNSVLETDLEGGVNPNQTENSGPSSTATPDADAAYQVAYEACDNALISAAARQAIVVPTGVVPLVLTPSN